MVNRLVMFYQKNSTAFGRQNADHMRPEATNLEIMEKTRLLYTGDLQLGVRLGGKNRE